MPETNQPAATVPPALAEQYEQTSADLFFGEESAASPPPPPAPAATIPPPPPAPAEKVKHKHSRQIERAAIEMGIPDEEIEDTPPDALQQRVLQSALRMARESRTESLATDIRRVDPNGTATRPSEVPPPPPPDPYAKLSLPDDGEWDESFTKMHSALIEHIKAQDVKIAALEGTAQQFRQGQVQTVAQRVESFMAENTAVYGERGNFDPIRHQALVNALGTLQQRTTLEHDLSKVHKALFGAIPASTPSSASPPTVPPPPPAPAPQPDPTREGIADAYRDGGLNRPTQRNPLPPPRGEKAAIAALDRLKSERSNRVTYDDDDDPRNTLP